MSWHHIYTVDTYSLLPSENGRVYIPSHLQEEGNFSNPSKMPCQPEWYVADFLLSHIMLKYIYPFRYSNVLYPHKGQLIQYLWKLCQNVCPWWSVQACALLNAMRNIEREVDLWAHSSEHHSCSLGRAQKNQFFNIQCLKIGTAFYVSTRKFRHRILKSHGVWTYVFITLWVIDKFDTP